MGNDLDGSRTELKYRLDQFHSLPQIEDKWSVKKKDPNFIDNLFTRVQYNNHIKSTIEKAIMYFNENPKKGIEFLLKKNDIIEQSPEVIAEFMLTTPVTK